MTSTKKLDFVHMGQTPLALSGRPHTVDMKYTSLS